MNDATTESALPLGSELAAPNMSKYREKLIEHVFIADLLQECAFVRGHPVEVLHAEVDDGGYDLVLQSGGILRHVQLKTRFKTAVGRRVQANANLEKHRGGCIVWMFWEVDPDKHRARLRFRWYGNGPRQLTKVLPDTVGHHTRSKAPRPNMRVLKWGDFEPAEGTIDIAQLVTLLFGRPRK